MTGPLLQHHDPRFSARNHPADALLGLVRATEWVEGFVARHVDPGSENPASPAPEDSARGGTPGDEARAREELTFFLLGLVATGRAARRLIEGWASAAPPPSTAQRGGAAEQRGWLR